MAGQWLRDGRLPALYRRLGNGEPPKTHTWSIGPVLRTARTLVQKQERATPWEGQLACHFSPGSLRLLDHTLRHLARCWHSKTAVRSWNHQHRQLPPPTASLVSAAVAKTIELSFVTVFVTFLGQVLSRRALVKSSKGITIAEMSFRSWIMQPGTLITHWATVRYAALTFLGLTSLLCAVTAMFYTTASDALVAPKLKMGKERSIVLFAQSADFLYRTIRAQNVVRQSCVRLRKQPIHPKQVQNPHIRGCRSNKRLDLCSP